MAPISSNLNSREFDKFKETPGGNTAVTVCGDETAPVPITGSFVLASTGPIKVTGTTVTDTSAAFPATNQTGRAALSIRNVDKNESIWVVNSPGLTLAGAGVDVWEIGPNETFNSDFDDTNKINLVADTGNTVSIQIMEIKG